MTQQDRILVVDDSAFMRTVIKNKLEKAGYQTLEAADGVKALSIARQNHDISLITLDVEMPNLGGFATCQQLRENPMLPEFLKSVPVVFITSYDSIEDRRRGFDFGAADFVCKENIETELLPIVDRILRPGTDMTGLEALVVDDSIVARKIITRILSGYGIIITEAENGKEALDIISRTPAKFDMLITDLNMPEMDGMELTRQVRCSLGLHQMPILMLSVTEDKITQVELFKAGITDYLTKPFIKEELLGRLRAHAEVALFNKKLKAHLLELKRSKEIIDAISNDREQLLHLLCHDVANPLGAVLAVLDVVDSSSDMFFRFKDELRKNVENGIAVIDMVRKLRGMEDDKIEIELHEVDLKTALHESAQALQRRFEEKNIHLEVDIPGDPVILAENTSLVNCVLGNLLSNAIKFSHPGSQIDVSAENDGDFVKIIIQDYGIGIPAALVDNLFCRNKLTCRSGTGEESGTGSGMPLVKKFVDKYGGDINIESRDQENFPDNHGTRIILRIHAL